MEPIDSQVTPADTLSQPYRYSVTLEDIPESLYAHAILGSASYGPDQINARSHRPPISTTFKASYALASLVRCVAIIEHSIALWSPPECDGGEGEWDGENEDTERDYQLQDNGNSKVDVLDTAVLTFPPGSLCGGSLDSSAIALITGEGTLSAPKGKYILYISLPVSTRNPIEPSQLLRPYLDAILKLGRDVPQEPLFTAFYAEKLDENSVHEINRSKASGQASWIIPPQVPLGPLGDVADAATQNAEILFHELLRALDDNEERYQLDACRDGGIWPRATTIENEDEV